MFDETFVNELCKFMGEVEVVGDTLVATTNIDGDHFDLTLAHRNMVNAVMLLHFALTQKELTVVDDTVTDVAHMTTLKL